MASYQGSSGTKWLPWILLLLALLALAGYLIYRSQDQDLPPADSASQSLEIETTASPSPSTSLESSTDLSQFLVTTDRTSLIGQTVNFTGATVKSVPGDKTFSIGDDTQQVYILLSSSLDDTQTSEQNLQVTVGQNVNVTGIVKAIPSVEDLKSTWGLSETEAQAAFTFGSYLEASSVTTN